MRKKLTPLFIILVGDHNDQVQQLQLRILELETEKKEFGSQRAKMKSLMLQTEGIISCVCLGDLKNKYVCLIFLTLLYYLPIIAAEKVRLQSEMDELRRKLAVMDLNCKNDLEEEKRKCFEQIASLEHLLHGKLKHFLLCFSFLLSVYFKGRCYSLPHSFQKLLMSPPTLKVVWSLN